MSLTGRQKIGAALSQEGTPEIAAVICYEGIYIRDHWEQLTTCLWWYQQDPDIGHQLQWRRGAIAATGQDWLVLPVAHPRAVRESLAVWAEQGRAFLYDQRTRTRQELVRPRAGGWSETERPESVHPAELASSSEEIAALIPLPSSAAGSLASSGMADLAAALLQECGEALYPIYHVSSPLWRCYRLWGFEGMMTMVATRPGLVAYACERLLAQSLYGVQQAVALGAEGMWIEECMTDMIAPAAFARLNLPPLRQLVEAIRAAGLASIYYYCGDPQGKWEYILDAGADALALEEGKKGFEINIDDVVERIQGRCAVLGNLDAVGVLQDGADDALHAEIARQIAAGRRNGSRFVMSLGSPVTPGTGVARVRRYCDLVHELGGASDGRA